MENFVRPIGRTKLTSRSSLSNASISIIVNYHLNMKNQLILSVSLALFCSLYFSLGSLYGQFKATNYSTQNGLETMNVQRVFSSPKDVVYVFNNQKMASFDGQEFNYVSKRIVNVEDQQYFNYHKGSVLFDGSIYFSGDKSFAFKFDSLVHFEKPDSSFLLVKYESGKKVYKHHWRVDHYGRSVNEAVVYSNGKCRDLSSLGVKHWYSEEYNTAYGLQRCQLIGKEAFLYAKLADKKLELLDKTGLRTIHLEHNNIPNAKSAALYLYNHNLIVHSGPEIQCYKIQDSIAKLRSVIKIGDAPRSQHPRIRAFRSGDKVLLAVRKLDSCNVFDLDGNELSLNRELSSSLLDLQILGVDQNFVCAYSDKNLFMVNLKENLIYSVDGLPNRLKINHVKVIGHHVWVATTSGLWQIEKSSYSRLERSYLLGGDHNYIHRDNSGNVTSASTINGASIPDGFIRGLFINPNNIWMNRKEDFTRSSIHYHNGEITYYPKFSVINVNDRNGYFLNYTGQSSLVAMPNYGRSDEWLFVDPSSGSQTQMEIPEGHTVQRQTFTDSTVVLQNSDSIFIYDLKSKTRHFLFNGTSDMLREGTESYILMNTHVLRYDDFLLPSTEVDGKQIIYDLNRNEPISFTQKGPTTRVNTKNYIYLIGSQILVFDKRQSKFLDIQQPPLWEHGKRSVKWNCVAAWRDDVFLSTNLGTFRIEVKKPESDLKQKFTLTPYELKSQAVKNMVKWKNYMVVLTEAGIEFLRPDLDDRFQLYQGLLPSKQVDMRDILVGENECLFITSDESYLSGYVINSLKNQANCHIWLKSASSDGTEVVFDPQKYAPLADDQLSLQMELVGYNGGRESYVIAYQIKYENRSAIRKGMKSIVLDNLKSGDYEIKVWAQLNSDPLKVPEDALRFAFSVPAHFSEGGVFIFLMILSGGLAVWLLARLRISVLKKRQDILENTVEERTMEVRQQKLLAEEQRDMAEKQKLIIEEKNTEILDSIIYAKRLQDAILPPTKLIKEWLSNSFVFYRPKDIVAGDFYWLENCSYQKEGRDYHNILFAVGDCTGHGVPGAMLSVVCTNALNDAVKKYKLVEPSRILSKVADLVKQFFNSEGTEIRDGMDIALCSLDIKNKKLYFSGANRPLYLVRKVSRKNRLSGKLTNRLLEKVARVTIKQDEKAVLYEFQGDRKGIGVGYDNVFSTITIDVEEDDLIYLFSDGFVDQFGGERNKKFMSGNFKKIILDNCHKSIAEQQDHLVDSFDSWKGDVEQIDDVCVIGVRVEKTDTFRLSKREIEMLHFLNQGLSSQEIAEQTFISVHTVNTHRKNMLNKLSAKNATEALNIARESGII